jgi:hypothetical protein
MRAFQRSAIIVPPDIKGSSTEILSTRTAEPID